MLTVADLVSQELRESGLIPGRTGSGDEVSQHGQWEANRQRMRAVRDLRRPLKEQRKFIQTCVDPDHKGVAMS
jgi:hypothetical protein